MADHSINIDFSNNGIPANVGNTDSSTQYLINVIQKLNAAVDRIARNTQTIRSTAALSNINSSGSSRPPNAGDIMYGDGRQRQQQALDDLNRSTDKALRDLGKKIGATLATSAMTAVTVTAYRLLNNQTNAIAGRGTASGQFMSSAIQGNANSNYSGYVGNLFDIELQRRKSQNTILAEGTGGFLGSAVGALVGRGGLGLAGAGGLLGASGGAYGVAEKNAALERRMAIQSALAQRDAMASISQWKTGFSRFGLSRTNQTIAGSDITHGAPIVAPISGEFNARYGKSQNFNSILNNITPYLQNSPLDMEKTGNLDKVAQNFLKAGIAVDQFSKYTMMGVQNQAITGKNMQEFSEDVKKARAKFGDSFDNGTQQNALNLMTMGYSKDQAQNLAFQNNYNPTVMSSTQQFMSQGITDWYRNSIIGKTVGVDINRTLATGHLAGATKNTEAQLKNELAAYTEGADPLTLKNLKYLMVGGITPEKLSGFLRNKVTPFAGAKNEAAGLSPGQSQAANDIISALQGGVKVDTMSVMAQSVNIIQAGNAGINVNRNEGGAYMSLPPSAYSSGSSPAKK